jgi:hypothetical protein
MGLFRVHGRMWRTRFRDTQPSAVVLIRSLTAILRTPVLWRSNKPKNLSIEMVEPDGIEPTTSSMPLKRSPN